MNTIYFVYYDNRFTDIVHAEDEWANTLCGTGYGIDNGEFLYSRREYDANIMRDYGLDPDVVTCKRCLKKLAKNNLIES